MSCAHLACEAQMYFWLSLFFGGREATAGNTSALRRLNMHETFQLHDIRMQELKAKIRFVQAKFMVPYALGYIIYPQERKEGKPVLLKQTPRSHFTLSQAYELCVTCQQFISN